MYSSVVTEPLDVLQSWVVELFGRVKEGSQVQCTTTKEMAIWKAGKIYRLEAVKDVHILELTWALPCLRQNYLKKAEDYLAHVLGHGNYRYDRHFPFLVTVILLERLLSSENFRDSSCFGFLNLSLIRHICLDQFVKCLLIYQVYLPFPSLLCFKEKLRQIFSVISCS